MKIKTKIKMALLTSVYRLNIKKVLLRLNDNGLIIVNYHRLYNSPLTTDFDEGVFAHSSEIFSKQIEYFKKYFNILSENDLLESIYNEINLPKNSLLITFDDGYSDNYNIAYPILQKMSVPAIFFIPFLQIENRDLGWWDYISYIVKHTKSNKLIFRGTEYSISTYLERQNTINKLLFFYKTNLNNQTASIIDELTHLNEVSLPSKKTRDSELMTWTEICNLSDSGFAIGSHTMSHRILSKLSDEEQSNEITQSKKNIELKIKKSVNSISYPVGGEEHFNNLTISLVESAGYKLGFTFCAKINKPDFIEQYQFGRIEPVNSEYFMEQLLLPKLFLNI